MNSAKNSQRPAMNIVVIPALLLLAGCIDTGDGSTTTTITINADSGTSRSLNGTWLSDCMTSGTDYKEEYVFSGDSITATTYTYTTTNTSCGGTGTSATTLDGFTLDTDGEETLGWADNMGLPDAAPMNQLNTASLNANPTVTRLQVLILGTLFTTTFFYMDDSAAQWCIYRDVTGTDGDSNGYNDYVNNSRVYCKQ